VNNNIGSEISQRSEISLDTRSGPDRTGKIFVVLM